MGCESCDSVHEDNQVVAESSCFPTLKKDVIFNFICGTIVVEQSLQVRKGGSFCLHTVPEADEGIQINQQC